MYCHGWEESQYTPEARHSSCQGHGLYAARTLCVFYYYNNKSAYYNTFCIDHRPFRDEMFCCEYNITIYQSN